MTNRPDLSRRKLLWGLTTIGAAATTGSSTAALLHDSAQTSAEMSAGTLDLSAAWGNDDSTTEATVESTTEGDSGEKRITLTVDDSPAYICFRTDCPGNSTDEQSRIDRNRTASDANRTDTARKRGTVSPDGRPDGTSSWGNAAPNQDRWNQKRDRSTSVDDRYQATSVEERLFVRYGIDRGDGSGVEWVSSYMMLLEARTTFGEGYCLEGELGPDDTWEFVVQWKADDVVMNTTDVEFDFEFYASQTRHVDSDTVDPDWECGTGGGTGTDGGPSEISWVAFCSSAQFDPGAAGIDPTLSDDGRTVSFSAVPDTVTTVVIRYGSNLDVVTYGDQTSITVGSDDATTYDHTESGFDGTDRTGDVPCPGSFGCKYEFPGWECKSGTQSPGGTEATGTAGGDNGGDV